MALIQSKILPVFVAVLAVFLQIQLTLFSNKGYFGLRVNLADILLPFLGVFILFSLVLRKSEWPAWGLKAIPAFLLLLAFAMTASLINGYLNLGYFSNWALVNKYTGLYILISYFLLGAWLSTNFPEERFLIKNFIKPFVIFFAVILSLSFLGLCITNYSDISVGLALYPWEGLMGNRNAFMLLAVLVFILYEVYREELGNYIGYSLWLLLPTFFVFNASRSGWIIFCLITLSCGIIKPKNFLKNILPILVLGSLIAYGLTLTTKEYYVSNPVQVDALKALMGNDNYKMHGSDRKRLIAVEDGLELYSQSNPVLGAGLGTYKEFQIEKRGEFIDIIDFTALWLLVETGVFGLTVFSLFFLSCLYVCYKKAYDKTHPSKFHVCVFFFLVLFLGLTLLHEFSYTRFLWVITGLAIAGKVETKKSA
ncbi:MAG: hypothetical protein CL565_04150 [Alphaproteobacteria bacterium]|nr:hypothetical protein [Alphaproteobacteria bacterium]